MTKTTSNLTMEELLASLKNRPLTLQQGQEVTGEIVALTDREAILDFGTKSEGVIGKHDLGKTWENLKVGEKLTTFVVGENESGQLMLATQRQLPRQSIRPGSNNLVWNRFSQAMHQGNKLSGRVVETNKGGLVVEVDGIRGFLPSSQIGFDLTNQLNNQGLGGQDVKVIAIEANQPNNRLIFSQKGISDNAKNLLGQYHGGQVVTGQIVATSPFGLFIKLEDGMVGIAAVNELSWERVNDVEKLFKIGQTVKAQVINKDESLGKLELSLKQITEDPFAKLAENYQADDTVGGTVKEVSALGVTLELEGGVEGFIPSSKTEGMKFESGQKTNVIVDSIDKARRRVNLAPLLTTTKGLIYK